MTPSTGDQPRHIRLNQVKQQPPTGAQMPAHAAEDGKLLLGSVEVHERVAYTEGKREIVLRQAQRA